MTALGVHPADEAQIDTHFLNRFAVRCGEHHMRIGMGEQVMDNAKEVWKMALMLGRAEAIALAQAIFDADAKQKKMKELESSDDLMASIERLKAAQPVDNVTQTNEDPMKPGFVGSR